MNNSSLYFRSFLIMLALVTVGFFWILLPYYAALFWATALAVLFHPVQRRLQSKFRGRGNLAAGITLLIVLLIVIIPMILIGAALIQEIATVYKRLVSGEFNLGMYFTQIAHAQCTEHRMHRGRHGVGDLCEVHAQIATVYKRLVSGEVNLGMYFTPIANAVPPSVDSELSTFGAGGLCAVHAQFALRWYEALVK